MLRILRNYLFWTYERGSFHYDVMVTLILAFIFISPHVIDFKDAPPAHLLPANGVFVQSDGKDSFVYRIDASALAPATSEHALRRELKAAIAPITGGVNIDHYQTVLGEDGSVTAYRVWVRR
jgi:hypothetical protein